MNDILAGLPAAEGHFLLESGYHTNLWITLDGLFIDPVVIAPAVEALAGMLAEHKVTAVCGPMLGGAFLAQALAMHLGVRFYYARPEGPGLERSTLFSAQYMLPPALRARAADEKFAVVDDVISAGSSVRATIAALNEAGGEVAVVGTLALLGATGADYFQQQSMPVVTLWQRSLNLWPPEHCTLCRAAEPLTKPPA